MQVFQEDDAPPGPDRQDQSLIRPDDQGLRAGAEDRLAFRTLGLQMTAEVFLDQRPVPRDSSEKPRFRVAFCIINRSCFPPLVGASANVAAATAERGAGVKCL